MSAEPSQITNTEIWTLWEGKLVNGVYPLRRFLGGSSHSGVFLSEQTTEQRREVAIKFVPAETVQAEAQLVQWGATTTLSHPNLVRIFDVGRHRCNGREFLFVVTEYAEQTLAEILPKRPLAAEEVRELLLPTFDALLFLHRKGLLHGRLKPSNFLAVNDRLKLASDTIHTINHTAHTINHTAHTINHTASGRARASAYDPPELKERGMNAAGDIWGLGMTLFEALTQRTTAWPDETVTVPDDFPAPFADVVRKCLSVAPGTRPTVVDLETLFKPAPPPSPPPSPSPPAQPSAPQARVKVAVARPARKRNSWRRKFLLSFSISLAAWIGVHFLFKSLAPSPAPAAPATVAPESVAQPVEPASALPTPSAAQKTNASPLVLHEVVPDLPRADLDKIRGPIQVTVRVLVDPDGNVFGAMLEQAGPNKEFAILAEQAAEAWKFAPTPIQLSRVWLVRFVFSRDGVTAQATAQ